MSGFRKPLIFTITLTALAGCASSPRLGEIPSDTTAIPAELEGKFTVTEATRKEPIPPIEKPAGVRAKKVVSKEKKPPPFVYPNRRTGIDPIWPGEKQVLEITYMGLKAGEFTIDVLPWKWISNRKVYHLKAHALSSAVMSLFYRVNDTVESYWDYTGLFSHRFHMVLDQSKQKRDALELFDSEAGKDFYWDRRNHVERGISETKKTVDMPIFPQDSFSALFYVRTLPLETGKAYTFPVVSEGKSWEAVVSVVRREVLDTPMGKKPCIVIRPQTFYQGVMQQQKGENLLWLTDDDRRFLARVEASVKLGEITAKLKSILPGEKPNVE